MKSDSYCKNKTHSFLKNKSSKIILLLAAILILICCLYFMSSDKNKLIIAVSTNDSYKQDGTVQMVMLDVKNKSMVTLNKKINCFDKMNYGGIAFSPDNKMIAHEKVIGLNAAPSIYIYNIDKGKDTLLVSPPPSDSSIIYYIPYFSWLDNNHLLYLSESSNSRSTTSDLSSIKRNYTFYSKDINNKKTISISFKGIESNQYINYMTYLLDHNKIYVSIQEMTSNNFENPHYTEKVYEYSIDGKSKTLLFSFKDNSVKEIISVPGTNLILFSTNKSLLDAAASPTVINKYDLKAKKLEKLYETPSPYPNTLDFIPYSKNNVLLQSLGDYEAKKYFDFNIKTSKCTEVDFNSKSLSTKFIAFSCK